MTVGAHSILYLLSFLTIWLGSGLIVSSADRFSKRLKLSSFAVSFFILGILTTTPEFAVGLTAIAEEKPGIFVGNLIGGIPVIFLLIIPLLAILGNGISLKQQLSPKTLFYALLLVFLPSLFVLDKRITNWEGLILIGGYLILLFLIQRKRGLLDKRNKELLHVRSYSIVDAIKIILGVGLVFASSNIIVSETLYFSNLLSLSPFYISLIFLSLGTNIPELSIALRSVVTKKKDVALGDYVGSAAANAFLFGVLTLMNQGEVVATNNFFLTMIFIAGGLLLFYYFAYTTQSITRKHGAILLGVYILFLAFEQFIARPLG